MDTNPISNLLFCAVERKTNSLVSTDTYAADVKDVDDDRDASSTFVPCPNLLIRVGAPVMFRDELSGTFRPLGNHLN